MLGRAARLVWRISADTSAPGCRIGRAIPRCRRRDLGNEFVEHEPCVACDGDVGRDHLAELGRIDVDMDLGCVDAEFIELAGDAIVPARSDRHDAVAGIDRLVGVGGAVHAEHAEVERMGLIRRAFAEQRVDDRGTQFLGESDDGLSAPARSRRRVRRRARVACGAQDFGRLSDRVGVAMRRHRVARQVDLIDEGRVAGSLRHVFGQIDQDRARASRRRDMEGLTSRPRNVRGVLDQIAVLHDGVGDARDVRFLEAVLPEHGVIVWPVSTMTGPNPSET